MLSINVAAFDVYSLDAVEDGAVVLSSENSDMEYLPEATTFGSILDSYGVGTSYTAIFAGVARKLPFGVNYVYWRDGQYKYCFAYGADLALSGSIFRADNVDVITYNTNYSYNGQPTFTVSSESDFSLSAGDFLVWSNLGHYPTLEDGRDIIAETTLFVLVGFGIFYFISRIVWRRFC